MKTALCRHLPAYLLLLSLLIAAAVPRGFMPDLENRDAARLFPIVLCTAYGEKTVLVPAAQAPGSTQGEAPPAAPEHAGAEAPCPYAPVTAQALPPPTAGLQPVIHAAHSFIFPPAAAPGAFPPGKPWQAQAPPLS